VSLLSENTKAASSARLFIVGFLAGRTAAMSHKFAFQSGNLKVASLGCVVLVINATFILFMWKMV